MSAPDAVTVAGVITAIATAFAAFAAMRAASAAAQQVKLQKPCPIVVIRFLHSFSDHKGGMSQPDDSDFWLQNIGDSPAFDIEVSPLETPGIVAGLGEPSRLETVIRRCLLSGAAPLAREHRLRPSRGAIRLRTVAAFLDDAMDVFRQQSMAKGSYPKARHEVSFSVSYSALDRCRREQDYLFVVDFIRREAWVEPVGSLLEKARSRG